MRTAADTHDAAGAVTTRPTTVLRTLREIRIGRGLTLTELALASGIHKGTLSQIERGRIVANPGETAAIGAALGEILETRTVLCVEDTLVASPGDTAA